VSQCRCHDYHRQQQQQQQQQLGEQLRAARERERAVTHRLETANRTIEDLHKQLEGRLDTIQGLKYELVKAHQKEIEWKQQTKDDNTRSRLATGRSDAVAQLGVKAPIGDMLYAFLSYTLTSSQQSPLMDSLLAKNIITAEEREQIQMLAIEEKVFMLLSRMKHMSTDEIEHWLVTISSVGQKQLVEAKLQKLCKYTIYSGVTHIRVAQKSKPQTFVHIFAKY